jgi:hypothetical protein
MPAKLVRATASFNATVGKVERFVSEGELYKATDPVVKAVPEHFAPETPVETATAAPGEKRRR